MLLKTSHIAINQNHKPSEQSSSVKYHSQFHSPSKMKFSIVALAGLASAVSAASLPARFSLIAEDNTPVLTDGRMLPFRSGYPSTIILTK